MKSLSSQIHSQNRPKTPPKSNEMNKVIPKVQIRLKRAKQARKLREKGYTLAEIAKVMGYKSINSVVYLLKWYEKRKTN